MVDRLVEAHRAPEYGDRPARAPVGVEEPGAERAGLAALGLQLDGVGQRQGRRHRQHGRAR
ncbi:MAG: hypothetical protein WKF75_15995 [Singulisphaera sp.]